MIRPAITRLARQWAEPASASIAVLAALWLGTRGGWFFGVIGLAAGLIALAWLIAAIRRQPFRRDVLAPGLVEVDEAVIRYYGAQILGGEIALRDLSEIRLLTLRGRAHWRLKSLDGQALLVPLDAAGAPDLADAFASLPGIRMGDLAAALHHPDRAPTRTLWVRPG